MMERTHRRRWKLASLEERPQKEPGLRATPPSAWFEERFTPSAKKRTDCYWPRLTNMLTFRHGTKYCLLPDWKCKCPVEEFLDSLPSKEAQKVAWVLRVIQELDKVPSQLFKKLTGSEEIWECRIQIHSKAYRYSLSFLKGILLFWHTVT